MDDSLGPGYDYWKSIKSPNEMGMSDEGTIKALSNDISGLLSYVSVLVTGNSDASVTGQPLGNKFFLKSMATCKNVEADPKQPDSETNPIVVPRYIYVDNVPDGTIPFIPSGPDGGKLKDFRGLIPGAIGNLTAFSPSGFGRAFTMGNHPDCINITLETVDNDNNYGQETHYVAVSDIMNEIKSANMKNGNPVGSVKDPCRFKDYTNPATNAKKTKAECEPEETDDFTLLRQSHIGDGGGSSIDGDSNEMNTQNRENSNINKPMQQQYVPENNTRSLYDILSIDNDTMFDHVHPDNRLHSRRQSKHFRHRYKLPDDAASRVYYTAIASIGMYLLYKLMWKRVVRR